MVVSEHEIIETIKRFTIQNRIPLTKHDILELGSEINRLINPDLSVKAEIKEYDYDHYSPSTMGPNTFF